MRRLDPWLTARRLGHSLLIGVPSLAVATAVVALLEPYVSGTSASSVYLVAVVLVAYLTGPLGAVLAAVGASLLFNYLFAEPRQSFTINDPAVWLSVLLLLFVGLVVGQLAALQRLHTETAGLREREARALFRISRVLATRTSTAEALPEVAAIVGAESRMRRVWIAVPDEGGTERIVADTGEGPHPTPSGVVRVLRRMPGDEPAQWFLVHQASPGKTRSAPGPEPYRVRIEATGEQLGSVWALRERGVGVPDRTETRLLSAAADQIGQALAQDRLALEAHAGEADRHGQIATVHAREPDYTLDRGGQ